MSIHLAEDAKNSVAELKRLADHIHAREITEREFDRCEPRIRLSYGDYTVEMPNIAQTYNAFTDAIIQMMHDITNHGW